MLEDTKSYMNSDMGSNKIRDIPKHPKGTHIVYAKYNIYFYIHQLIYFYVLGFVNQWGALLEQQHEVQLLAEEHDKHRKIAKNYKYKTELEAQLHEKDRKARLDEKIQKNPQIQKQLFDDCKKFEQNEYERVNDCRVRSKQIMDDNMSKIHYKMLKDTTMTQNDKDQFKRRAHEDNLNAQKTAEERRKYQDWQRETLKKDYDNQIYQKENLQKMERDKEIKHANQYKNTVNNFENKYYDNLDTIKKK
jgi:hypothetical protein